MMYSKAAFRLEKTALDLSPRSSPPGDDRSRGSSYLMYRTNCADLHIDCAQLDESYLASHKLLLISGTSLSHSPAREAVFHAISLARRNHVAVAFDLDYREDTWDTVEEASLYLFLCEDENAQIKLAEFLRSVNVNGTGVGFSQMC